MDHLNAPCFTNLGMWLQIVHLKVHFNLNERDVISLSDILSK